MMRAYGLSQLPVAKGEMPLAAAEILGAVDELALMDRAGPGVLDEPVEKVMGTGCPPSAWASRSRLPCELLTGRRSVLAGGRPRAVLSRTDVLRAPVPGHDVSERSERP